MKTAHHSAHSLKQHRSNVVGVDSGTIARYRAYCTACQLVLEYATLDRALATGKDTDTDGAE